jgi:phage terminase large subunit
MRRDQLDVILAALGERLEHVGRDAVAALDLASFRGAGGREAFAREVLHVPALLGWQLEGFRACESHSLLAVRSANSCGKTAWNLMTALYECFVNEALVLYGSATWRQNRQQGAKELKKMLAVAPALGGDVYSYGLVTDRHVGVVNFIGGDDASALQGYHDRRVVVILDEFQGSDDELLEAAFANISGGDSSLIVTGNPLQFGTPFHRLFTSGAPGWWRRRVSAEEVLADPAHDAIHGLVTKNWIDQMRWQYGEESATFGSRVRGEFPRTPDDAMFPAEHVVAAFERHRRGELVSTVANKRRVFGIDIGASAEGDESVIAMARGGYVEELVTWREPDTMRSVGRIIDALRKRQVPLTRFHSSMETDLLATREGTALLESTPPGDPILYVGNPVTLRVDEIGVGRGVSDRLREAGFSCEPFNASRRSYLPSDADRYANVRAEAYDRFRTMLVRGQIALPYDPLLEEELLTCRAFTNSSGRLQVISKAEWRIVLGRSPDRLDAVVMAVAASGIPTFEPCETGSVAF